MKSLTILLALFATSTYTAKSFAQYSLSPRVGEVIDQNERQYFGLFPTIEGFVSAKASVKPDHLIEFIIDRAISGVSTDTTFRISSTIAENLTAFIEDFESYRRNEKEVNWKLLDKLVANAPAIESKIGNVAVTTIETIGGDQLIGKILLANDTALVIWQSSEQYNWRTLLTSTKVVKYSGMNNINIEQEGSFWLGLGYGALLGATTVATFGLGVNVGNDISEQSNSGARPSDYILIGTAIGAGLGAIIGGIAGASQDIDTDLEISGRAEEYINILPMIKEHSVFLSYPPPELVHFANQ